MKRVIFGCAFLSGFSITLSAFAAAPMEFGQWSSLEGVVSASCPSETFCSTIVESSGFLQQAILDDEGNIAQIHTIILNKALSGNADTLPFSTENFVQRNDPNDPIPGNGLANRQVLSNDTINSFDGTDVNFEMINTTESGWAADIGEPNITTDQLVSETDGRFGKDFSTSFQFKANLNENGIQTGSSLRVDQEFVQQMGIDQSLSGDDGDDDNGGSRNADEALGFALGLTRGDMTPSGSATLNGKTVSWNPGDTVAVKWVGQSNNHWQELEEFESNEFMPGFEALKEEYLAYENRTSGEVSRFLEFGGNLNPDVWLENQFGLRPSMPSFTPGRTMPGRDEDGRSGEGVQRLPNSVGQQFAFQEGSVPLDVSDPAGAPVDFSAWSVVDGDILSDCPADMTCSFSVGGQGFLQQIVADNNTGQEYIRSIITDVDATGSVGNLEFSSESLVAIRGDEGLINLQVIKGDGLDDANQNAFADRSVVRTGWADEMGLSTVEFSQQIATVIPEQGFSFDHLFEYEANIDSTNGSRTGFTMNIEQIGQGTYSLIPQKINTSRRDEWMYVRREVAGDMLTSSGSSSSGGDSDNGGGGRVSWSAGDDIKVTWFGLRFDWEEEGRSEDTVNFYYQGYDNVSDNQAGSFEADREDGPGPKGWNSVFGEQPVFPFSGGRNNDD